MPPSKLRQERISPCLLIDSTKPVEGRGFAGAAAFAGVLQARTLPRMAAAPAISTGEQLVSPMMWARISYVYTYLWLAPGFQKKKERKWLPLSCSIGAPSPLLGRRTQPHSIGAPSPLLDRSSLSPTGKGGPPFLSFCDCGKGGPELRPLSYWEGGPSLPRLRAPSLPQDIRSPFSFIAVKPFSSSGLTVVKGPRS